ASTGLVHHHCVPGQGCVPQGLWRARNGQERAGHGRYCLSTCICIQANCHDRRRRVGQRWRGVTWETPISMIDPEFQLYEAYPTQQVTLRDLLSMQSGLPVMWEV